MTNKRVLRLRKIQRIIRRAANELCPQVFLKEKYVDNKLAEAIKILQEIITIEESKGFNTKTHKPNALLE